MNQPNLTNKQLRELDSLFELVSQRQTKDFGNISACLLYTSDAADE